MEIILQTNNLTIYQTKKHFIIKNNNTGKSFEIYPTRTFYKFIKYVIPQYKLYLKDILDKHTDLFFEIWQELTFNTVTREEYEEFIERVYNTIKDDLYNNLSNRNLSHNSKRKQQVAIQFDNKDNLELTFLSDFIKLFFPIFILEKYSKPYIEYSIKKLYDLNEGVKTVVDKLFEVIKFRVNILFNTKTTYFTYLQHIKQIDDVLFMGILYNVIVETLPFAYDTTNTVGFTLTLIEKHIGMRFLEVFAKIVQHYDYIEYKRDTGIERQYQSSLIDLTISNHVVPYVETIPEYNNSLILEYKNNFNKMWPYMKFIIIPYMVRFGFDYSHIVLSRELYWVPLAIYKVIENKHSLLAQLLISKRVSNVENVSRSIFVQRSSLPRELIFKMRRLLSNLSELYGVYEDLLTGKQFTINNNHLGKLYTSYLKQLWSTDNISFGYLQKSLWNKQFAINTAVAE